MTRDWDHPRPPGASRQPPDYPPFDVRFHIHPEGWAVIIVVVSAMGLIVWALLQA